MANNLPTFDETAQVSPAPVVSSAPVAEAAASVFGGISKTVYNQALTKEINDSVIPKGEMAGLNPNFKPAEGIGPATAAFNRAALATNKLMISRDISTSLGKLAQESAQNPDANDGLASFTAGAHAYGQTLLQGVPDANKATALELLKYHTATNQIALNKRVAVQNKATAQINYQQNIQSLHGSMINAVQNENDGAAQQFYNQARQANDLAFRGGFITAPEHFKANTSLTNDYQQEVLATSYKNALATGPVKAQAWLDNFNKSPAGMTVVQKEQFTNRLANIHNQFIQAQGITKESARSNLSKMVGQLWRGGKVDNNVVSDYDQAFPGQIEESNVQIQEAQTGASIVIAALAMPLAKQNAYVNSRLTVSPNAPISQQNRVNNLRNNVLNHLAQANHAFSHDRIAAIQNNPLLQASSGIKQIQDNVGAGIVAQNTPASTVHPTQPNPIQQKVNFQQHRGIPEQSAVVMTNDTAKQNASIFNAIPNVMGKIDYINQLHQQYGSYFPNAMQQLVKSGVPASAMIMGSIDPQSPLIGDVQSAYTESPVKLKSLVPSENLKAFKTSVQQELQNSDYIKSLSNYQTTDRATYQANVQGFVDRVGTAMMVNDGTAPNDAAKQALALVGDKYNYTSLQGQTLRVPKEIGEPQKDGSIKMLPLDPQAVAAYAVAMKNNNLRAFPFTIGKRAESISGITNIDSPEQDLFKKAAEVIDPASVIPGSIGNRIEQRIASGDLQMTPREFAFQHVIKAGHWVTNNSSSGMVYVDRDGVPVHTAQGKLFSFKFSDVMNNQGPNHFSPQQLKEAAVRAKSSGSLLFGGQ